MVENRKEVHMHYIRKKYFILDVITLIPLDIVMVLFQRQHVLMRTNRLLRIYRMNQFFDKTETHTNVPHTFRILNMFLYIFMCIHFFACVYFFISYKVGFGNDEWVFPNISDPRYSSVTSQYVYSIYWATLTLTTIGEMHQPQKDVELIFVTISFLVGVLIFASIVGSVGNMITNINVARSEFLKRMDAVKKYFEMRGVDKDIQERVFRWFSYIWENKLSFEEDSALAVIPTKLRAEVLINVHLNTLKRVSIFKDCEAGLLAELVLKLKLMVFSPNDMICKKGDVGREMYIIKNGWVQVISDTGNEIYATLTDGSVFGEVSLLNIPGSKYGNRRTANVRSVGYSDIFVLSKEDLWDTLKDYPDAKDRLMERGRFVLMQQNLVNDEFRLPSRAQKDLLGEEMWTTVLEFTRLQDKLRCLLTELQDRAEATQNGGPGLLSLPQSPRPLRPPSVTSVTASPTRQVKGAKDGVLCVDAEPNTILTTLPDV